MTVLVETDAVPDEASDPGARGAMLTPWACGLEEDAAGCDADRCGDIMPELMVELI